MEEMELLVEACNTPATTTTTTTPATTTTTAVYPTTPTINIVNNGTGSLNQMFNSDIFVTSIISDGIIESPNYPENYPNNYDEVCKYSVSQINESFAGVAFGGS